MFYPSMPDEPTTKTEGRTVPWQECRVFTAESNWNRARDAMHAAATANPVKEYTRYWDPQEGKVKYQVGHAERGVDTRRGYEFYERGGEGHFDLEDPEDEGRCFVSDRGFEKYRVPGRAQFAQPDASTCSNDTEFFTQDPTADVKDLAVFVLPDGRVRCLDRNELKTYWTMPISRRFGRIVDQDRETGQWTVRDPTAPPKNYYQLPGDYNVYFDETQVMGPKGIQQLWNHGAHVLELDPEAEEGTESFVTGHGDPNELTVEKALQVLRPRANDAWETEEEYHIAMEPLI